MLDWRLTLYLKDEPVALFNLHQYKGVTQRAGEKAEKEMHLRLCRQEEAKTKQRAAKKVKKIDAPAAARTRLNN